MLRGMRDPPRMKVGGEDAMTLNLTRRMWLGALPGLAFAGAAAAQTPAMVPQDDLTASLDTWLDLYGRPTAKVMLNGRGPFSFMVDTGSTVTVLAQRHLETIGAPLVGTATVAGTTGMAETPFARINSVEAGDLKKRDVRVAVLPDDGVSHIDGILGADAFVGKRLEFSIPSKTVKILNSRHPIRVAPRSQMRIRNGLLAEIDGRVGNVNAKLMLDTGAQNCIANFKLSEALLKAHPRLVRLSNAQVFGVTGHVMTGQYIELPKVEMRAFSVVDAGAVALQAPIFDLWKLNDEPAMIVGMNLLSRLRSFTIDYGARSFDAQLLADLIARNSVGFG